MTIVHVSQVQTLCGGHCGYVLQRDAPLQHYLDPLRFPRDS